MVRICILIAIGWTLATPSFAQIDWELDNGQAARAQQEDVLWAYAEDGPELPAWAGSSFLFYQMIWVDALADMSDYFDKDSPEDSPEQLWDDHCDQIFDGLIELQARMQEDAPDGAEIPQDVVDWIVGETEGASQLCEAGRQAAMTNWALTEAIGHVDKGSDHAEKTVDFIATSAREAVEVIERLDDSVRRLEPIIEKEKSGRALTDAETLAMLDASASLSNSDLGESAGYILNLVRAADQRNEGYAIYLKTLEAEVELHSNSIANLPSSLGGSSGIQVMYDEYLQRLKQRRNTFEAIVKVYAETTEPLRSGDISAMNLPMRIKSVADLKDRADSVLGRFLDVRAYLNRAR